MDKSFEGLLLSLVLHILLLVYLWNAKVPHIHVPDKTEVTLIEEPRQRKQARPRQVVLNPTKEDPTELPKDEAALLAQTTQRVKKQTRAALEGAMVNAGARTPPKPQTPPRPKGIAGLKSIDDARLRPDESGSTYQPLGGESQPAPTVAVGQSSSEYIPGIEEAEFTNLSTDQFTYFAFYHRVNEQVRNRWVPNLRSFVSNLSPKEQEILSHMNRTTDFEVVINPDGQILKVTLMSTCGDKRLDQINIDAVRDSAPFLNPPRGMIASDGNIHMPWRFTLYFRPPMFGAG